MANHTSKNNLLNHLQNPSSSIFTDNPSRELFGVQKLEKRKKLFEDIR